MIRALLVLAGTVSLGVGVLGIFVPGLPTTVFLLGAAACYVKSSEKMYNWLLKHKILGTYIYNFRKYRAMPMKSKVIALIMMWIMIGLSAGFFIENITVKIIVLLSGVVGTVAILMVKTLRKE